MKQIHSFWVDLGWSKEREVMVMDDGRAYFEIAEENHCEICKLRISMFKNAVRNSGTNVRYDYLLDRYPHNGRTLWGGIEIPTVASEKEIRNILWNKAELDTHD